MYVYIPGLGGGRCLFGGGLFCLCHRLSGGDLLEGHGGGGHLALERGSLAQVARPLRI